MSRIHSAPGRIEGQAPNTTRWYSVLVADLAGHAPSFNVEYSTADCSPAAATPTGTSYVQIQAGAFRAMRRVVPLR